MGGAALEEPLCERYQRSRRCLRSSFVPSSQPLGPGQRLRCAVGCSSQRLCLHLASARCLLPPRLPQPSREHRSLAMCCSAAVTRLVMRHCRSPLLSPGDWMRSDAVLIPVARHRRMRVVPGHRPRWARRTRTFPIGSRPRLLRARCISVFSCPPICLCSLSPPPSQLPGSQQRRLSQIIPGLGKGTVQDTRARRVFVELD